MQANPYQAPRAALVRAGATETELAGRGRRLIAVAIDTVCLAVAWAGAEWGLARAGFEYAGGDAADETLREALWAFEPLSTAIGFMLFLAFQGPLLFLRAQTVGKVLLQIRIVDLAGRPAPFGTILLRRELPGWLANLWPGAALAYLVADALPIFHRSRRCLHDRLAGTRVVVAR